MEIHVRRARKKDIATIISLWKALMKCGHRLDASVGIKSDAVKIYEKFLRRQLKSQKAAVFVAERKGKLLGHVMVSIHKYPPVYAPDNGGFVNEIFVRNEERGKGTGTRLLKAAEGWCRERGLTQLDLTVHVKNERAIATYTAFGLEKKRFIMKKIL